MGEFSFKRPQRLLNASEFQQVFDHVDAKVGHQAFLILATCNSRSHGRLGLIVAKKHLKRAVARNAFKRQVRESFRIHQAMLGGIDLIVMARAGAQTFTPQALRAEIEKAWPRLRKRLPLPDKVDSAT